MAERRQAPRSLALKRGQIIFNDGRSVIDCTVRNISTKGARLVAPPVGIPDRFVLLITADQVRHACRVIWRRVNGIGVAFEDA